MPVLKIQRATLFVGQGETAAVRVSDLHLQSLKEVRVMNPDAVELVFAWGELDPPTSVGDQAEDFLAAISGGPKFDPDLDEGEIAMTWEPSEDVEGTYETEDETRSTYDDMVDYSDAFAYRDEDDWDQDDWTRCEGDCGCSDGTFDD